MWKPDRQTGDLLPAYCVEKLAFSASSRNGRNIDPSDRITIVDPEAICEVDLSVAASGLRKSDFFNTISLKRK
jgi:hypothetical protein